MSSGSEVSRLSLIYLQMKKYASNTPNFVHVMLRQENIIDSETNMDDLILAGPVLATFILKGMHGEH